jgi:hypothetical protein
LTSSDIRASARYEIVKLRPPDGGECTALRKVTVRIVAQAITIRIDQRYPPGSCEYQAILSHEREHARITTDTLRQSEDEIGVTLRAALSAWHDRWLEGAVQPEIERAADAAIDAVLERIEADIRQRQAAVDTPAAYADVQRQCGDW